MILHKLGISKNTLTCNKKTYTFCAIIACAGPKGNPHIKCKLKDNTKKLTPFVISRQHRKNPGCITLPKESECCLGKPSHSWSLHSMCDGHLHSLWLNLPCTIFCTLCPYIESGIITDSGVKYWVRKFSIFKKIQRLYNEKEPSITEPGYQICLWWNSCLYT